MDVPRRNRVDLLTPAETAIHEAMRQVETLPGDERLTHAITLLQEARDVVSDYVDGPEPPAKKHREFVLSVIFFKDGDAWVARCLQRDIAAQAPSLFEAQKRFRDTLRAQIMVDLRDDVEKRRVTARAPAKYWDMWRHGLRLAEDPMHVQCSDEEHAPGWVIDVEVSEMRVW